MIHLFAMWCRVLQNMDERQSAVGVCGRVRRMRRTNEAERYTFGMKDKNTKREIMMLPFRKNWQQF